MPVLMHRTKSLSIRVSGKCVNGEREAQSLFEVGALILARHILGESRLSWGFVDFLLSGHNFRRRVSRENRPINLNWFRREFHEVEMSYRTSPAAPIRR